MWYLDKFSLSPFDERYIDLPFEWMEFSYHRYMNNYGYDVIRNYNVRTISEAKKNQKEKEELESQLTTYGSFDDAQTADIMKAFKDAKE